MNLIAITTASVAFAFLFFAAPLCASAEAENDRAALSMKWNEAMAAGEQARENGDHARSVDTFRNALHLADGFGPDSLQRAVSLYELADVYYAMNDYKRATGFLLFEQQIVGKLPGSPMSIYNLRFLSVMAKAQQRWDEAMHYCEEALGELGNGTGKAADQKAEFYTYLFEDSFHPTDSNRERQRLSDYREKITADFLRFAIAAQDDWIIAQALRCTAHVELSKQQYAQSERDCLRSLALSETFGKADPDTVRKSLELLVSASYAVHGRSDEMVKFCRNKLEQAERNDRPFWPWQYYLNVWLAEQHFRFYGCDKVDSTHLRAAEAIYRKLAANPEVRSHEPLYSWCKRRLAKMQNCEAELSHNKNSCTPCDENP